MQTSESGAPSPVVPSVGGVPVEVPEEAVEAALTALVEAHFLPTPVDQFRRAQQIALAAAYPLIAARVRAEFSVVGRIRELEAVVAQARRERDSAISDYDRLSRRLAGDAAREAVEAERAQDQGEPCDTALPTNAGRIDLHAVRRDISRANDPAVQGEGRRVVESRVRYAAAALVDEVSQLRVALDETMRERDYARLDAADHDARVRAEERQRIKAELARAAAHPFKGPNDTDSSMLIEAAKRIEGGYLAGGSHTRETTGRVLRLVADMLTAGSAVPVATPPAERTAHDATVAAQALMGVVGEIDDLTSAELVTRRAMQFEQEARDLAPVATPAEPDWQAIAGQAVEALRLTREYVEPKVRLAAHPGWSWFDATNRYRTAVGLPPLPETPVLPAEQDGQR